MTVSAGCERGQVLFAHDTEVALTGAAALVNTVRDATTRDELSDVAALDRFVDRLAVDRGAATRDAAELAAVRALRPRLEQLWDSDVDEAAELVNALLRESHALPQLVRHDELGLPRARRPARTRRWPSGWPSRRPWRSST